MDHLDSNEFDELERILQDPNAQPCGLWLQYLRDITNNFSSKQELGRGGFGVVYKGLLPCGAIVAVKNLLSMSQFQESQFKNEVDNLMRVRHQNIVRFVGYCYETWHEYIEFNGRHVFADMPKRLICFEYMPNGSLDKHISEETCGLDWQKRYKVIKGICCGLHYLHKECQINSSIIHLDLKPENISLDDNMVPKIADFGLAKLFEDPKTQSLATSPMGSRGYMAPEYLYEGIISTKADIYSLGVIIIQMITGLRVKHYDSFLCEDFVEYVVKNWRSRSEAVPSETDCKQIKSCLEIGLSCIKTNKRERPNIREILDIWESTNFNVSDEERPTVNQDDLEHFNDVRSLHENIQSILSNEDGDASGSSAAPKLMSPAEPNPAASKGWTLERGNFQTQYTPEEHADIITDVCFRPNSSQMATSSLDETIKLWNANDPQLSLHTFIGHSSQVMSLEFHPKETDLLCSRDGNGEIRYWNVTQLACMRAVKGGTGQVRFQPNAGQFLAVADENVVSIFDIETHGKKYTLQGHKADVESLCWDNSGEYLASVSNDLLKVWSMSSGECIHELSSDGNMFQSCVFHPTYTTLLIVGGYQSLVLWNMAKNQSMTVQADGTSS